MARTTEQILAANIGAVTMQFCQLQSQAEAVVEELERVKKALETAAPKVYRKLYPKPDQDGLPIMDFPAGLK